jgi:outer membrane protein
MGLRIVGIAVGFGMLLSAGTALAQPRTAAPPRSAPPASRNSVPAVLPSAPATQPHTLQEALAATYANNPSLQASRAQLRATDEGVPQALAGWRPTIVLGATAGYGAGNIYSEGLSGPAVNNDRIIGTAQATVTQPIYRGGKTQAQTNQAKNNIYASRANLVNSEETVFFNAVQAYVGVIEANQLLQLNNRNVEVLTRQLQATNDRFRVGEITRTDVAQAESALAGAIAQRETSQGNVATANATYLQVIGYAPTNLIDPQPLRLPVRSEQEAAQLAAANNPSVIAALFTDAAAKDAVDVAFSNLAPQLSLQATGFQNTNSTIIHETTNGGQVVASLTVPIYQGGSEYSAVRQARQTEQQQRKNVDNARRTAVQAAVSAWQTLVAARATADSTRSQIRANEIALEGVEREAIVGSRTTLDVLNQQQALLTSEVTLVQNLAQIVTASYQVAQAMGRLTARDLTLNVPLYDETAYYNAVRDRLWGTGDYATDQPGR